MMRAVDEKLTVASKSTKSRIKLSRVAVIERSECLTPRFSRARVSERRLQAQVRGPRAISIVGTRVGHDLPLYRHRTAPPRNTPQQTALLRTPQPRTD